MRCAGLNGSMILRGGTCQVDFGWYCADDPPGAEVIHPLVTASDMVNYHDVVLRTLPGLPNEYAGVPPAEMRNWFDLFNNNDKGFVPTIQMAAPAPKGVGMPVMGPTSNLSDIQNDAAYAACPSKQIGFAFKGNPVDFCPQSKFSQQERNEMSTFGAAWNNTLIYASRARPGVFYMAFEDLPTRERHFLVHDRGRQRRAGDGDGHHLAHRPERCAGGGARRRHRGRGRLLGGLQRHRHRALQRHRRGCRGHQDG
jgi:hypothetical protein